MTKTHLSIRQHPNIVWEKWNDPIANIDNTISNKEDSSDYDEIPNIKTEIMKCLATPMGISSLPEESILSKNIDFWVGYTNFNLSAPICNIINQASGVETFDVFTRYRFRVGIGKLFKAGPVISKIAQDVSDFVHNTNNQVLLPM